MLNEGRQQVETGGSSSTGWVTSFKIGKSHKQHQLRVASNNSFQIMSRSTEVNELAPKTGQIVGGHTMYPQGNG